MDKKITTKKPRGRTTLLQIICNVASGGSAAGSTKQMINDDACADVPTAVTAAVPATSTTTATAAATTSSCTTHLSLSAAATSTVSNIESPLRNLYCQCKHHL